MNELDNQFENLMMALALLYKKKEAQPSDIIAKCSDKSSQEYHLFKQNDSSVVLDFTYVVEPEQFDIDIECLENQAPSIHVSRYVYDEDMYLMETYSKAPGGDFKLFWSRHQNIVQIKTEMRTLVKLQCSNNKLLEIDALFEEIEKKFKLGDKPFSSDLEPISA